MDIRYKTLSGKEEKISTAFRTFGMKALWDAMNQYPPDSMNYKLLDEAHAIMSGVLFGEITKEEDNPLSSFPNEHYKIWDEKEKNYVTDHLSNNGLFPDAYSANKHAEELDIQFQIHKFKDNKFIQPLP